MVKIRGTNKHITRHGVVKRNPTRSRLGPYTVEESALEILRKGGNDDDVIQDILKNLAPEDRDWRYASHILDKVKREFKRERRR